MTNAVESLLEDDHDSLGKLLAELDREMAQSNVPRAFELLDLFWARLAVHIRAENLHLFPALTEVSLFIERAGVPSPDMIQNIVGQLRADHDFFMKELAEIIKAMREMLGSNSSHLEEIEDLRRRMMLIKERLDRHNQLEEEQVYVWPALVFDEQAMASLCESLRKELGNLPPRFS